MTVEQEVQKLNPDALIQLFQLDASDIGGDIAYFHADTTYGPIWWRGIEYTPYPIKVEGFARTSEQPPTPKMIVANLEGMITQLCLAYQDLVGAKITVIRTFAKFLDVENYGKKNKLLFSEGFSNAAWIKSGVTVTPNTAQAPDGTFTASRLNIDGAGRFIGQTVSVDPSQTYTLSADIKTESILPSAYKLAIYDLTNGQWLTTRVTGVPNAATWTRVEASFDVPSNCTQVIVYPYYNATAVTGSILIWGAQLELGVFATTYEPKDLTGRNPDANPNEELPPEIWFIERKSAESNDAVEFELASAFDLLGVKLPRRQIIANYCSWKSLGGYRGPYCGYTGPPVAKFDDTPTSNPAEDDCSGRLSGCEKRLWPDKVLNFGGFPAAGLTRV